MLITNHVLTGAIIGALARTEQAAFAAGVASHFALDAIPHWGARSRTHFLTTAVIDGLIGASVMTLIARHAPADKRTRVLAGMAGATLPDANKPGTLFFGRSPFPKVIDKLHGAIQIESPDKLGQEVLLAALFAPVVAGLLRDHVAVTRAGRP